MAPVKYLYSFVCLVDRNKHTKYFHHLNIYT